MIKQADEVKYVGDLASNVNLHLAMSKKAIKSGVKMFEERDVAQIASVMHQIVTKVDNFMEQKKKNTMKESYLCNTIFSIIREEEILAEKQAKFQARRLAALASNKDKAQANGQSAAVED